MDMCEYFSFLKSLNSQQKGKVNPKLIGMSWSQNYTIFSPQDKLFINFIYMYWQLSLPVARVDYSKYFKQVTIFCVLIV